MVQASAGSLISTGAETHANQVDIGFASPLAETGMNRQVSNGRPGHMFVIVVKLNKAPLPEAFGGACRDGY